VFIHNAWSTYQGGHRAIDAWLDPDLDEGMIAAVERQGPLSPFPGRQTAKYAKGRACAPATSST
jgi:hypothetical protein